VITRAEDSRSVGHSHSGTVSTDPRTPVHRVASRKAIAFGILVGLPISAALLLLSLRHLDGHELRASLGGADGRQLSLAIAVMAAVYVVQATRWRVIAGARGVPVTRFVEWVVGAVAVNNVMPGRAGDLLRAEWLARGIRRSRASSVSSVVVDRGLDVVTLVLALVLTYPFVPHAAWLRDFWLAGGALGILVGAAFVAAIIHARRRRSSSVGGERGHVAEAVRTIGAILRGRSGAAAVLLSILGWATWALGAWLVASSLGISLTPLEVLFVTAVLNLGVAIPSSPGFIGTYQWLGVSALGVLGVGHTRAFAFAVVVHAAWFVPTTVAGAALALRRVPHAVVGALAYRPSRNHAG
jgi:glycosyltransferase 2 family protein